MLYKLANIKSPLRMNRRELNYAIFPRVFLSLLFLDRNTHRRDSLVYDFGRDEYWSKGTHTHPHYNTRFRKFDRDPVSAQPNKADEQNEDVFECESCCVRVFYRAKENPEKMHRYFLIV